MVQNIITILADKLCNLMNFKIRENYQSRIRNTRIIQNKIKKLIAIQNPQEKRKMKFIKNNNKLKRKILTSKESQIHTQSHAHIKF